IITEIDDCAFSRQDPVASLVAPEDGKFILTVKEATNSGPGECHYVFNIGSFARPLAAFPAGGVAGEELKVKLLGDAAGPLERMVKLPAPSAEFFDLFP